MGNDIESAKVSEERKRIAREIEGVFETFYRGESVYSKGQFYKDEFFLRSEYALVVLNENNDILVSFADQTRPSYAALFTLLLDDIEGADLFICEDYKTDREGSMVCDEENGSSTGAIIWDEKDRYYGMLREKVDKVVIRKTKSSVNQQEKSA
ncbi:MAG: hypothetical protein PVG99_08655 [Desulfobacteraceae bacterium]|jgi:hypothetical protein